MCLLCICVLYNYVCVFIMLTHAHLAVRNVRMHAFLKMHAYIHTYILTIHTYWLYILAIYTYIHTYTRHTDDTNWPYIHTCVLTIQTVHTDHRNIYTHVYTYIHTTVTYTKMIVNYNLKYMHTYWIYTHTYIHAQVREWLQQNIHQIITYMHTYIHAHKRMLYHVMHVCEDMAIFTLCIHTNIHRIVLENNLHTHTHIHTYTYRFENDFSNIHRTVLENNYRPQGNIVKYTCIHTYIHTRIGSRMASATYMELFSKTILGPRGTQSNVAKPLLKAAAIVSKRFVSITRMHVSFRACIHTYIHAYIRTYIHTYINVYT